jgi:hypothetical protein
MRAALMLLFLCVSGKSVALNDITLNLESLSADGLHLEGVRIALAPSGGKLQRLQLTVAKINLPQPFDVLSFFELHCPEFTFNDDNVSCAGGQAKIVSPWLDDTAVHIDFRVSKAKSSLTLGNVKFAGGTLGWSLHYSQGQWLSTLSAQNLQAKTMQRLAALPGFAVSGGVLDVNAHAQGRGAIIDNLQVDLQLRQFNAQSGDGKQAAENLHVNLQLQGRIQADAWQWHTHLQIPEGALYSDPVYLATGGQALALQGRGEWRPATRQLRLSDLRFTHPGVGQAEGRMVFQDGALRDAEFSLQTSRLDKLGEVYLQPFLTATAGEGVGLSGQMQARAEFAGRSLTRIDVRFPQLHLTDAEGRFALQNAAGALHWAKDQPPQASLLSWDSLHFYGLPLGRASLAFSAHDGSVRLNRPVGLPLCGGELRIARFAWQGREGMEPEVHFQGDIDHVSLQKLTDALHWPPLSGQLSGNIPGVHYRNRQLRIDGALQIRLFDGEVRLEGLQFSNLLGSLPRLNANVTVDNLDLEQITRRFPFGGMQGRLSGFIRDLALEGRQPVTFYAWLGTPDGDASTHRISQKAVNSLASIGGGGAADLVSRSLLRMFDNFGYDKLGIGCYLHRGVCQLSGVAAAEQGFYIVKGGGLPRIDVIGYNPRIDWQILLQRLRRVLATDKAIIQ